MYLITFKGCKIGESKRGTVIHMMKAHYFNLQFQNELLIYVTRILGRLRRPYVRPSGMGRCWI